MADAIAMLSQHGAIIVDPANIPSVIDPDPDNNFTYWGTCSGADEGRGKDDGCSVVLKYGMKRDFNALLLSLGPAAPVASLTELRAWNDAHQSAGSVRYGQAALDISDEMDLERDRDRYEADRAEISDCRRQTASTPPWPPGTSMRCCSPVRWAPGWRRSQVTQP